MDSKDDLKVVSKVVERVEMKDEKEELTVVKLD
jgi:hypothetical protein